MGVGWYRDGVTAVAAPVGCKNTSDASVAFAAMLQQVVATSPLPVWEKKGNKGFWRMLTVQPPPSTFVVSSNINRTRIKEAINSRKKRKKGIGTRIPKPSPPKP